MSSVNGPSPFQPQPINQENAKSLPDKNLPEGGTLRADIYQKYEDMLNRIPENRPFDEADAKKIQETFGGDRRDIKGIIEDRYSLEREEISKHYTLGSSAYKEEVAKLDAQYAGIRKIFGSG